MDDFIVGISIEENERYMATSDGRIYDLERDRYICEWVDNVGYYQCIMRNEDKSKNYQRVHRLVAKAWVPNEDNRAFVNHIDGDKLNNSVSNLEWCTNSENTKHGYEIGAYHSTKRSHKIRVSAKDGSFTKIYKSIRSACNELNINRKTVTSILKGDKKTNGYDYTFEYVDEGQETIESIA